MAARFARVLLVAAVLACPEAALAQSRAPNLSKEQRQALLAAVTAAKTATALPAGAWQMHLLRASDGSHYVAFSAEAPPDLTPAEKLAMYVRLEPKLPDAPPPAGAARSAVEEWLLGQRSDPLPMRAARVVQIPTGEMPVGGLAATQSRDGSGQNSAVLALIDRQRERARAESEAREKARREELEGRAKTALDLLPFEDFDMAARVVSVPGKPTLIRRAITAGPGTYDVVVSWAVLDGKDRATRTGAFRQPLTLPPAQTADLALGSIIIADEIRARTEIYGANEQTAHPYTIGGTEIEPAADHVFTNDERLAIAFQVLNAVPSATGKPDVGITFRLFRRTESGEEPSAALAPLQYGEGTLPVDFDLNQGHPLLAAFAAPLRTLPRGEYRLAIAATDRIGRSSTSADTRFRVIATPAALLAGAPAFTARFSRARFVEPDVFDRALDALAPHAASPALARLLALARERRFVDLIPEASVGPDDRGTAMLFQSMAAYALGDTARALAVQLRRALEAGAPPAPAQFWLGASLALDARDEDALTAWRAAAAAGWPAALLAVPMAEAEVRMGRLEQAAASARAAMAAGVSSPGLVHIAAAADLAARRFASAAEVLAPALTTDPNDPEAQWLMLHALFAGRMAGEGPGATPEGRDRLVALAGRYVEAGGRHRALAEEWRAFVTSSASAVP